MLTHRSKLSVLVFLLPPLVLYIAVVVFPVVQSLVLSFFSWNGVSEAIFVGFENYVRLFTRDDVFWSAALHSVVYVGIGLLFTLGASVLLANLLLYVGRGRETVKTLFLLPALISTVAIALLFNRIYAFDPAGLLNQALQAIGLPGVPWLSDVSTSLVAASVPEGWRFMGLYMLIFYAALLSVPRELEEAARLDGSSEASIFLRVRLPHIRPVFITTAVMATTYGLRGFDVPYLLTGGGPGQSSELLTTYMYKAAFTHTSFGFASAIAVVIVVQCVAAVGVIFALFRRRGAE